MIQQNRAKKNIRRRLFFFITASVLPLFADDVVQPNINNRHHEKNGGTDAVVDDHADDMTQRSSLSLPQHQIDGWSDDCTVVNRIRHGNLREKHVVDTFLTPDDRNDKEFVIKYRLFKDNNQQWIEGVLLPLTQRYNGTGSIGVPFYPFDDTGEDIRSQTYRCSTATSTKPSNDKLSNEVNSTTNEKDFDGKGVVSASNNASNMTVDGGIPTNNRTIDESPSKTINKKMDVVEVDYASKSAGAVVLDASKDFQGTSNLLQSDRDKYAIVPCNNNNHHHEDATKNSIKYVVIGLSEDILVKQITIANYERYSSHMKEIQLYGSATTSAIRDAKHWVQLGNYIIASSTSTYGKHTFDLTNPTWARYLKIEFLSHYGNEYYCTVSQISVHGSTVLQGFHEQWNEDNDEDHLDTNVDDSESHMPSKDDSNEFEMKQNSANTEESRLPNSDKSNDLKAKEGDHNIEVVELPSNLKQGGKSQIQGVEKKTPNITHRYSFSRIGCRNSISFEENLNLHSSPNMSESLREKTSSLSRISFRSHSFTKCCGAKSIVIPKKKAIGRVKVHHASHHHHHHDISTPADLTTKTGIDRIRTVKAASAGLQDRHLSTLFTSMERVTDFLRSTLGAFDVLTNQTSKADNATRRQRNVTSTDNDTNEQLLPVDEMQIISEKLSTLATVEETILAADDTNANDVKRATNSEVEILDETNSMIAIILQRLPSAKCLESLNFVTYKAVNQKSMASSKTRNGSNGSINAHSGNGVSSGGGGTSAGGGMEPIFKKLTDEIKALQSNVAIHDQYASASIACYHQIIFEMLLEMESDRRIYNERITKLEDKLHSVSFLQSCQRLLLWIYMSMLQCNTCSKNTSLVLFMLLLCGAGFLMILLHKRRSGRSRFSVSSTSPTLEQSYDINVTKNDTISFQYANHVVSEDDDDSLAEIISITPIVQAVPQLPNHQHREEMVSPE